MSRRDVVYTCVTTYARPRVSTAPTAQFFFLLFRTTTKKTPLFSRHAEARSDRRRRRRRGLQVPLAMRASASCRLLSPRRLAEAGQGCRLDFATGCWLRPRWLSRAPRRWLHPRHLLRCLRRRWEGQQGSRGEDVRVGSRSEQPCGVAAKLAAPALRRRVQACSNGEPAEPPMPAQPLPAPPVRPHHTCGRCQQLPP